MKSLSVSPSILCVQIGLGQLADRVGEGQRALEIGEAVLALEVVVVDDLPGGVELRPERRDLVGVERGHTASAGNAGLARQVAGLLAHGQFPLLVSALRDAPMRASFARSPLGAVSFSALSYHGAPRAPM
jgi:hypothetical protein